MWDLNYGNLTEFLSLARSVDQNIFQVNVFKLETNVFLLFMKMRMCILNIEDRNFIMRRDAKLKLNFSLNSYILNFRYFI